MTAWRDRTCDFCGDPLPRQKRADARFCDSLCRGRSFRTPPSETPTNVNAGISAPRRPTRDGRGAKIYLQPSEISYLTSLLFQHARSPYATVRKFQMAKERLKGQR